MEQSERAAPSQTVGEMLRETRQRLNLDAADVARQLRLGLRQVEALEANDFAALPGNTIVRGFIRNYARLLQVDPVALLAAYEATLPAAETPKIAATAENIDISPRRSRRWLWVLLGIAAFVIIVPVVIYALLHDRGPVSIPAVAPVARPAPAPKAAPTGETSLSLPMPAVQPVETVPVEAPPAQTQPNPGGEGAAPAAPQPAVTSAAEPVLLLAFEEDAWVEVRDGSGKKLYSQVGRKGESAPISGQAPFSFVVGNATKVRLIYKGKSVDLQPFTKVNVARLTLE